MAKKRGLTAADAMASLSKDAGFICRSAALEDEHRRKVADRLAARGVVNNKLAGIGVAGDFAQFRRSEAPLEVLALLFDAIANKSMPPLEIGLAAECFAHPSATAYWNNFIELYREHRDDLDPSPIRDGLAAALGMMCTTREQLAELYELIEDSRFGFSRIALLGKVKYMESPVFQELFERMVERDEQLRAELLSWKSYWKKKNPALLEKWKGWRQPKRGNA